MGIQSWSGLQIVGGSLCNLGNKENRSSEEPPTQRADSSEDR
jgi:hypothetical protein